MVGALRVPDALQNNPELDTVEEIQARLETKLVSNVDNKAFYDIALKTWDAEHSTWIDVTEENFPEGGVEVLLEYPQGTNGKDIFTIVHMLTTSDRAGEVEVMQYTAEADGLHFRAMSLSPFAVGWVKYVAPVGGGGGAPAADRYAVTVAESLFGGAVTAGVETAEEGDTVALTAAAEDGFRLARLTVTAEDGTALTLEARADGTYVFTMPAGAVTVRALFLPETLPFADVEADDWFFEAVAFAYGGGLMDGVSEDRFDPDSTLTRAMTATILWRLEGSPEVDSLLPFTDVDEGSWYAEAVRWAASEGIVLGVSDTSFAPGSDITREELATMLYRYAQYKGYDTDAAGSLSDFNDADDASDYAVEALTWAVDKGLITGVSTGTLLPRGTATRAQAATMLMRFCVCCADAGSFRTAV